MGAENLGPLGFDPWIVHPVASHYTNSAIPAHMFLYIYITEILEIVGYCENKYFHTHAHYESCTTAAMQPK